MVLNRHYLDSSGLQYGQIEYCTGLSMALDFLMLLQSALQWMAEGQLAFLLLFARVSLVLQPQD